MTYTAARTTTRSILRILAIVLAVIAATMTGTLIYQSTSSSAAAPGGILGGDERATVVEPDGVIDEADGTLPGGVTVFDDRFPAVANLDSDLLHAMRQAAAVAGRDAGIEFYINSGWRSGEYQDQLLRDAVSEYGSEEEAARWVATAETSAHVSGTAIDIGEFDATLWLSEHGAAYGLCQIYGNEPWHYELRPEAISGGCPRLYADPTEDPRMQLHPENRPLSRSHESD